MEPFKAKIWAKPENDQCKGQAFNGIVTEETATSFSGKKDGNGSSFHCSKSWWSYEEIIPTAFTKSDLENGMIVETRDSCLHLVVNDHILLAGDGFHRYDEEFSEDLLNKNYTHYDVVAVYSNKDFISNIDQLFNRDYLKVIWKRTSSEVQDIEREMRELAEKQNVLADKLAKLNGDY